MAFSFLPIREVRIPEFDTVEQLALPAEKTALIVVDMQNDFVHAQGALTVPAAAETVPRIADLLARARRAGVRIAFTQDTQVKDDPEFDIWPEHCIQGSWGWEIVPELQPRDGELICMKNRYDGFYGTWLDHFLGNIWGVEQLVIAGTSPTFACCIRRPPPRCGGTASPWRPTASRRWMSSVRR